MLPNFPLTTDPGFSLTRTGAVQVRVRLGIPARTLVDSSTLFRMVVPSSERYEGGWAEEDTLATARSTLVDASS